MDKKERLYRAIKKKEVDRPPCICPGGMMNSVTKEIIEARGIEFKDAHHDYIAMSKLATDVHDSGYFENFGVPFCMTVEAERFGSKVNFGNNVYEPHVIKYPIESVKDWKQIKKIEFEDSREKVVIDSIKYLKSNNPSVPIIGNITGPISTASSIIEPMNFYKELRKSNIESHEFINFIIDGLKEFIDRQIKAGVDIIAISDPSATGEILGPKLFLEFTVKYINELISYIKKRDIPVIVHICGQMKSVYKEVNKIESDVLSFDSVISIKEAKEKLKGRIIMGNISTYTIEFGERDKIISLTEKALKDGADIISPACGLGMRSPSNNIKAILSTVKLFGGD